MQLYKILPFQFEGASNDEVLLINECGDFIFISSNDFDSFIQYKLRKDDHIFNKLKSHLFLAENEIDISLKKMASKYATKKVFLRDFTTLHMLVVTLRCNQRCEYCQVSCADENAYRYDMTIDIARSIVDMIFQSPTNHPKIEFQGGEPLLNWDVVKETVFYAEEKAKNQNKEVSFVICTNLIAIKENHLIFCKEHNIQISTSLDGNKIIHDRCRKNKQGGGTYEKFMEQLEITRKFLGKDRVSALMTTTAYSLERLPEVINEYKNNGMDGIFIRSLNPYGFAAEQSEMLSYSMEKFVQKYLEALVYIIDINKQLYFPEFFATLLFSRILTPFSTGFVDLQSPSGAGISGVIYDFDGAVYPSDEARMLARMGDSHFYLGNVNKDSYQSIFAGNKLRELSKNSCLEITAPCAYCVYQAYCGTDPIRNYLESGNELRNMEKSPFCVKHKGIFTGLFNIIRNADDITKNIIWSWITKNPQLVKRECI